MMYGRDTVALIGGWLGRVTVLAVAVGLGGWWADGLLRASRRTTDLLLTAGDLKQLAVAADENQTLSSEERLAMSDESQLSPNQGRLTPPIEQQAEPVAEEAAGEAAGEAAEQVAGAVVEETDASGATEDGALPERTGDVPEFGSEGRLQSFLGSATTWAEDTAPDDGSGRGLAWTIRFDRAYSTEHLGTVAGTRLAAVRPRRVGAECLPISGWHLGPLQDVESWLRDHPQHSARHGILLPRSWFRELEDRLLPLGGGWQFWLLIEDALFAQWIEHVSRRLVVRGTTWEDATRIEARLTLIRVGGEPQWRLEVTGIETKAWGES